MATTIASYNVAFSLKTAGLVDAAKLSRKELSSLQSTLRGLETPADKYEKQVNSLTAALKKGAITQEHFNRAMKQAQENAAGTKKSFDTFGISIKAIGAAAAVAFGKRMVSGLINIQHELDETIKVATKLGLSFNELSSARFAASEIGGMDAGAVDTAMKKMQISIAKAASGNDNLTEVFQRLGIDAGLAIEQGPIEALKRISDAFRQIQSPAARLKVAAEIFGKGGTDMVDTLMAGRDAIEESAAFQEKWNSLTDAQAAGVEANNDAWGRVAFTVSGITNKLAAEFAPAMNLVADEFLLAADGVSGINESILFVVDSTTFLLGVAKDVYDVFTLWGKTLYNITTLNFDGFAKGLNDAMDFGTGSRNLEALYAKRAELANQGLQKQSQREAERQRLLLEDESPEKEKITDKSFLRELGIKDASGEQLKALKLEYDNRVKAADDKAKEDRAKQIQLAEEQRQLQQRQLEVLSNLNPQPIGRIR